jgi:Tfp pilus assembly protein PilF
MKNHGGRSAPAPAQTMDVARLTALAKAAYAEKDMDAVLDLSSRLLEADPENFVARRFIARIHSQRGDAGRAEPIWRELCATARDKLEPALNMARIAYARGDWSVMAEFADLAVRESGGRADALRLAITARTRAKRPERLSEMLVALHDAEPERFMTVLKTLGGPELAQAQAATLARLGAGERAGAALDALARECRKAGEVGALRAESRKDDEVRASYLRAIWTFDPGARHAIDGLNALSRQRLKFLRMAIHKGEDAEALHHAEAVTQFNPASFEAWFAIARLSETHDPERSAECFRICAELKPADGDYRFRQGLVLVKSDRLAEAMLAFRAVREEAGEASDPLAIAAEAEIAALKRTVFRRAVDAARAGRLDDARTGYLAATGSARLGGGRYPAAARVVFWAWVCVARIEMVLRDAGRGAGAILKRARSRYVRVRRRLFERSADASARRIAAGSARR